MDNYCSTTITIETIGDIISGAKFFGKFSYVLAEDQSVISIESSKNDWASQVLMNLTTFSSAQNLCQDFTGKLKNIDHESWMNSTHVYDRWSNFFSVVSAELLTKQRRLAKWLSGFRDMRHHCYSFSCNVIYFLHLSRWRRVRVILLT